MMWEGITHEEPGSPLPDGGVRPLLAVPFPPEAFAMRSTVLLPLVLLLAPSCRNACQALCKEMYEYGEECGHSWTDDDLKACYEGFARSETPKTDRESCQAYYDDLREWWDCDDIARYFDEAVDEGEQSASQETGGDAWVE